MSSPIGGSPTNPINPNPLSGKDEHSVASPQPPAPQNAKQFEAVIANFWSIKDFSGMAQYISNNYIFILQCGMPQNVLDQDLQTVSNYAANPVTPMPDNVVFALDDFINLPSYQPKPPTK